MFFGENFEKMVDAAEKAGTHKVPVVGQAKARMGGGGGSSTQTGEGRRGQV